MFNTQVHCLGYNLLTSMVFKNVQKIKHNLIDEMIPNNYSLHQNVLILRQNIKMISLCLNDSMDNFKLQFKTYEVTSE